MAKQISISITDEMHALIQDLKEEIGATKNKKKISKICQEAIHVLLIEAKAMRAYRLEGIKDGKMKASSFSDTDKQYISRVLSKTGPYKKWARFDKIEELKTHFENKFVGNMNSLYPRFIDIMNGSIPPFHEWVSSCGEEEAEDRRGEVAWSYIAGFYEGLLKNNLKI